jgi:hypothetical protein
MQNKKPDNFSSYPVFCRDDKIRTCDLYVPNVARYRLRHIPFSNPKAKLQKFLFYQIKQTEEFRDYFCAYLFLQTYSKKNSVKKQTHIS